MNIGGWVGGGVAGTGSAMQFMAQGKREVAQNRVAGKMRKATTAYGRERKDISDNLRKALDSIVTARTGNETDYFENRNSPERNLEGNREREDRIQASQSGLNTALAVLNGPPDAYRGADSQFTPGQSLMQPGDQQLAISPIDQSQMIYSQLEQPMLQGVLEQLANQGFLEGVTGYDVTNSQNLAMAQRPLDNEMMLRQLLTGVRQGETKFNFDNTMAQLNKEMERANKVGSNEMLWGSILQNIGTGIAGGSNFNYQSAHGGSPNEAQNPEDRMGDYSEQSPGATDLPGHGGNDAAA